MNFLKSKVLAHSSAKHTALSTQQQPPLRPACCRTHYRISANVAHYGLCFSSRCANGATATARLTKVSDASC
eukprot:3298455-Pleurochrysis_carterae.AAC.1